MLLLLRKLYLYFTNDSEGSIIFQGVFIFFRGGGGGGPNANFPYTHLLFSNGGVQTRTPLWIRTWAMSS